MAVSSKRNSMLADATSPFSSKYTDIPLGSSSSLFPFCGSSAPYSATQQIIGAAAACRYENGKVSAWIEAMRASSPSRQHKDEQMNQPRQPAPANQYAEWLETHPSALASFAKLMEGAERKRIAVFLDYDGTLSPIVENPEQAFMSDEMRAAVKQVASHFPTAIISGRGRDKVKNFVQLSELYYAGSHGMDIMGPVSDCSGVKVQGTRGKDDNGNDVVLFQPASEFLPMMNEVFDLLVERAKDIQGATVENNTFCITIHFRRVGEESWHLLAEEVQNVLKDYPKLRLTQGRKVLEVRPCIEWDKGKAVEYLLRLLGLEDSNSLPIYIGDDRTDEDAFDVFKRMQIGCGILVSRVAKATSASFSLRDPPEVMKFLHSLVEWSRNNSSNTCQDDDAAEPTTNNNATNCGSSSSSINSQTNNNNNNNDDHTNIDSRSSSS